MNKILINSDYLLDNRESINKRLFAELENIEIDFLSENKKDDLIKLKKCNIYFGNDFNPQWLNNAKNLFWIIIECDNEKKLIEQNNIDNDIVVTTYSTFQDPIEFFVELMRHYIDRIMGMNLKYVEIENIKAMIKRYFNGKRIQNIMDNKILSENDLKNSMLKMVNMYSREELLNKFNKTGKTQPALNFTANSTCNRKCIFCDAKNIEGKLLSPDQYKAIATEANLWNITKASLSGGEPTLRQDIVEVVCALNEGLTSNKKQIGITTNGSLSYNKLDSLIEAGLTSINFSIHSLNPDNYKKIMGSGNPKDIIEKIEYCLSKGLQVKVNCTLMRSYIQDAYEMILLAKRLPVSVRLIELQYIGPAKKFFDQEFVSEAEMKETTMFKEIMKNNYSIGDRKQLGVRTPGVYYKIDGWKGLFSFISNTSHPICIGCNRIKITPSGRLRACILDYADVDLIPYLLDNKLDEAFKYLFMNFVELENNPYHKGYHHIDYNLRWNNYVF